MKSLRGNPSLIFRLGMMALLLSLFACTGKSKHKPPRIDPGFSNYISAFSSGQLSCESTIRIRLANDCPFALDSGKTMPDKLFSFSPAIKGKLSWADARTLVFTPTEKLIPGRTYDVEFQLGKLINVPQKFKVFRYQFSVLQQAFAVSTEKLFIDDVNRPDRYQLQGVVMSADVIGTEIEKVLEASQGDKSLKISWNHDPDKRTHYFQVDSITRGEKEGKVNLTWNGKPLDVNIKGEEVVVIPPRNDYRVVAVRVFQEPEQYILLTFSDPLEPTQNLDGLIRIGNQDKMKFTIENNTIKIFPGTRLSSKLGLYADAEIKSLAGKTLTLPFAEELSFEDMKPAVRLIGNGVILPRSSGLILPFEAVNLNAVDIKILKIFENNVAQFLQVNPLGGERELKRVGKIVYKQTMPLSGKTAIDFGKWNTFSIDLSKLIEEDPGAIYRVTFSFKKSYSLYACAGDGKSTGTEMQQIETTAEEDDSDEEQSWNEDGYEDYYYDYYPDDYQWTEREDPCKSSYYTQDRFVSRNILASDMGIIAKSTGTGTMRFAITDLRTTEPMEGVEIELYTYQNQRITKGTTDGEGMAELSYSGKAYFLVARKDKQRGYLKLDDGSSLSLSKFDVGGAVVQKGVKGFLYGERGVWRPGDTLFLTFILEDKNGKLPPELPVSLDLTDPRGQLANRIIVTKATNFFYRFSIPTQSNAPTGNWTATVRAGGATFSKTLKIETIKPNRLKISLDFNQKILMAKSTVKAKLSSAWLTGAIAHNLRATVNLNLQSARTAFEGYKDFVFDDPGKRFSGEEQVIFDAKLNDKGEGTFIPDLNAGTSAPGMLNASFMLRVYEEGGDFSSDFFSLPYAPYTSFVGLKVPKGERYSGMLVTDAKHKVEIATVDANGRALSRENLSVEVFKVSWRWWWNSSDNDLATYEGSSEREKVFSTSLSTVNGKGSFDLMIPYPSWGRYLIRVKDPESGHSAGTTVYMDWPAWKSRDRAKDPEAATMLSFTSDKSEYKVGEMATLTIPCGGQGRALLSLETGSKILDAYWLEAKGKELVYSFKITPEMAPNFFANVTLVQPHAQTVNDLPIRLYGVIPILVTDPATKLQPVITMPAVLRPEEKASIRISEKNGRAMTYTIAVVDEGLLDLTRFKTPDPWSTFYAREALGIKTWDMFDLVLGAYGGKLEQVFAIGGDEGKVNGSKKKANRFKPMVIYLGPFDLKAGATATHNIKIGQYIGSVRTMVVAGNKGAYGAAEKATPVKKPLMVLATLPRVLGPGESLKLPVTVFAMEKNIKDVKVEVSVSGPLSLNGSKQQNLSFSAIGDKVIDFDLKVLGRLGIAKINVVASCGNEKAVTNLEVDVRNPNTPVTEFVEKALAGGQSWKTSFTYPGMEGTNKAMLEVSGFFPMDMSRRLEYLIQYPHGCVEQTTSSGFPQLFVEEISEPNQQMKDRIQINIKATIQKLRAFQQSGGGFGYWPGSSNVDDWSSCYAGHFLLEAERKGYALPPGMKENWLKYQANAARNWNPRPANLPVEYSWSDLTQAYRLFTLALGKSPQLAAMNRMREMKNLNPEVKSRLAAAYARAGQKEVARELLYSYKPYTTAVAGMEEIYGSPDRDAAMTLEALCLIGDKTKAFQLARRLGESLGKDYWMSTQTTAYALLSISKYMSMAGGNQALNFSYSLNGGASVIVKPLKSLWRLEIPVNLQKGGKIDLKNLGTSMVYARVVMTGAPLSGVQKPYANNLNLSISFKDIKGNAVNVMKLEQGSDFVAEVKISNSGLLGAYKNIALTQIFPSGWEIINYRLADMSSSFTGDKADYTDIRDDRVMNYFDLPPGRSKTFVVMLNAAYLGRYYLPGPYGEAMYDNRMQARLAGNWVEVVRPGK